MHLSKEIRQKIPLGINGLNYKKLLHIYIFWDFLKDVEMTTITFPYASILHVTFG